MSKGTLTQLKIIQKNLPKSHWMDSYHQLLSLSWTKTLGLFVLLFSSVNLMFALLYKLDENALNIENFTLGDAFFFSVHTISTIGYGHIHPVSSYANILVTIEVVIGLILFALLTGVIFSKFSLPKAKVMFTNNLVIHNYEGVPTLMYRVANARKNQIIDATLNFSVLIDEETPEGIVMKRIYPLELKRSDTPVFAMSNTGMHVVNESSPLYPFYKNNTLTSTDMVYIVTIVGTDGTYGQTIHSVAYFNNQDIKENHKFSDILTIKSDGARIIDFKNFHSTEEL